MRFILVSVDDKNNTKPIDIPDEIVVSSDTHESKDQEPIVVEKQSKEKESTQKPKTHQISRLYGQ